ncbi:MAG: hypothetical protein J2P18_07905 [Nocardia sp.]|nr:hypothetical protein [Nocardia sp.]
MADARDGGDAEAGERLCSADAVDGWELSGEPGKRFLVKQFGALRGLVTPTTATTCAWRVENSQGRMLREVSARSVADARSAVERWVEKTTG